MAKRYQLQFSNSTDRFDLSKRLLSAHLTRAICEPAYLKVRVGTALPKSAKRTMQMDALPKKCNLEWKGEKAFHGLLLSSQWDTGRVVELVFADPSYLLTKVFESGWVKQTTLQAVLQDWASAIDLPSRFIGSFSDRVSGFSYEGKSLYEMMLQMSLSHGFYFFLSPEDSELVFVRVGSKTQTLSKEESKNLSLVKWGQSLKNHVGSVELTYLRATDLARDERTLSSQSLYQSCGPWAESSRLAQKEGFGLFAGRSRIQERDERSYEEAANLVPKQTARAVMGAEEAQFRALEPICNLGAQFEMTSGESGRPGSGPYFVSKILLSINSNCPSAEIIGHRV